MKYIIFALLFIVLSIKVHASDCNLEHLVASYSVSFVPNQGSNIIKKTVKVYRMGNTIAYEYVDDDVVEVWSYTANKKTQLVKLFPQYQRGIEYQSADLIKPVAWKQKYHMIAPSKLIDGKSEPVLANADCQQQVSYEIANNSQPMTISWMPNLSLPASLKIESKQGNAITWQLSELSFDQAKLANQFKLWDAYHLTDYTDIGDNEQDPFLAKMIHQGFSPQHDHKH